MTCNEFQGKLRDLLDGAMERAMKAAFQEHLVSCPECKKVFEAHQEIVSKMKGNGQISPPSDFRKQVMKKILSGSPIAEAPVSPGISLLLAGGMAMGILVGGAYVVSHWNPGPSENPRNGTTQVVASDSRGLNASFTILKEGIASQAASQGIWIDKTPE